MIADRMKTITASGIRKVFDLAQKIKDPVDLSIGQPDIDVPETLKTEAIDWIRKGFNRYTPTQGTAELIAALHADTHRKYGREFEDILVTSGTSGGLLLAILVLINPGDEVIIPDPYFVMYKHLVNLVGGKPVFVETYPDFELKAEAIERKITKKTKLLVVNSPCNPTGVTYREQTLKDIALVAKKHGLLVFSDEIYESLSYDGPCPSICRHYDNVLLINGFSKSHAMTGWRVGFAAGRKDIIQEMAKMQQYSFVCAPSFAQKAALKALTTPMDDFVASYRRKRDLVYNGLKDRFEVVKPTGAFYIFPKAPGGSGEAFVKKAIENKLLIIPGNVFSEKDSHFRLAFSASDETIRRGVEILNSIV